MRAHQPTKVLVQKPAVGARHQATPDPSYSLSIPRANAIELFDAAAPGRSLFRNLLERDR